MRKEYEYNNNNDKFTMLFLEKCFRKRKCESFARQMYFFIFWQVNMNSVEVLLSPLGAVVLKPFN